MNRQRARLLRRMGAVAALALALAACGSDDGGVSTGRADESATSQSPKPVITVAPPTTEAPNTEVATTEPAATEPEATEPATAEPTTTEPPATAPATTAPMVASGWISADTFPVEVFGPFDESNWTGVPSPPLPAAGQRLADGTYEVSVSTPWSAANPNVLDVSVHRLAACTDIPDVCISYGDPFGPREMGVDTTSAADISVPLTNAIAVGLTGFDCESIDRRGNGADLAALFTAFDTAYNATVKPLVDSGQDAIAVLTASPANGFSGESLDCSGGLLYNAGNDAPPLLLQVAYNEDYDSNGNSLGKTGLAVTDEMHLNTVVVSGGVMTLYLYAGFFS